jgi:hypothetical protein
MSTSSAVVGLDEVRPIDSEGCWSRGRNHPNTLTFPHNIVFNFWSETGLLGAVAFTAIFVVVVIVSWKG